MHIDAARFTSLCEQIFKNCNYFIIIVIIIIIIIIIIINIIIIIIIIIIIQILVRLLFYSLNKRDLKERLFNLNISSNCTISRFSILSKATFDQACD